MSDDSVNNKMKPSFHKGQFRAKVAVVIGLASLALMWFYNRRLETRAVYVRIPVEQDGSCEVTFIPTHTNVYELEVELRVPADSDAFEKCIRTTETGALDGEWVVESTGEQLAAGTLGSYLYLSMTGPSRRRVLQAVGLDSYQDVGAARMSRGVGRFRAVAGQSVDIKLTMRSAVPQEFAVGEPRLVVRLNRRVTAKYLNRSMAVVLLSVCLVLFSLLSYVWFAKRSRMPNVD